MQPATRGRKGAETLLAGALALLAVVAAGLSWWWTRPGEIPAAQGGPRLAETLRRSGLPEPPRGAHVVLPPDALRSIDRPAFVPATRARLEPDAPMVLVRGRRELRAYSLRLLNAREIVNDELDGKPIAVTW